MKSFALSALFAVKFSGRNKAPFRGLGVGHLRKIHEPHRILFQNFVYLCCILPRQCFPAGGGADGWDDIYEEGVYLTLCFPAHRNFATFIMYSRDKAMVDACGDMLYIGLTGRHPAPRRAGCALSVVTYRRGLLRCSFKQFRAMRRPLCAGRVTGTDSRASFLYMYVSEGNRFLSGLGSLTGVWQISIISTWKRNSLLRLCTRTC